MAWEQRRGNWYYYRPQWIQGRVVKTYLGRGPKAEAAASEDAERRAERAALRNATEDARLREEPAGALLAELDGQVTIMLRAALAAAGFHQHARGQWRKKRYGKESETPE
jgi:hypothetical protein